MPALLAEVAEARAALDRPAARRLFAGGEQALRLDEVAALLASGALVVDACRRGLRAGAAWRPLARRPVLFALARALAEAWPGDVDRQALIACAFGTRRPDETHRARLRVEIGRLRALVAALAHIEATARGFVLRPRGARAVVVLAPPIDGDQASLRGAALRRRGLVDLGAGAGPGSQPAHRPARARRARGRRTGALDRAGAGAALAVAAAGGIHDNLVTPRCAAETRVRLAGDDPQDRTEDRPQVPTRAAEIVREFVRFGP